MGKNQPWACPLGIRRFFVSPQESGELCLMASIMGESGDIFFPKLDEEKDMIPFDQIALDLLKTIGLRPDICKTEKEAIQKSLLLNDKTDSYPIYFFGSDTSGEKAYEEFFTDKEILDMDRFINLGVVKNSKRRSQKEMDIIFEQLRTLFESKEVTKSAIVEILKQYFPNFSHIEKGKGLDSRM